jgi:plasmid stabilization system protein ParE
MDYAVSFTARAERDLELLYLAIDAQNSATARRWHRDLAKAILSLKRRPYRCPVAPENARLRQLLHGKRLNVYRVIFRIVEKNREVQVLHIRHGARKPISSR